MHRRIALATLFLITVALLVSRASEPSVAPAAAQVFPPNTFTPTPTVTPTLPPTPTRVPPTLTPTPRPTLTPTSIATPTPTFDTVELELRAFIPCGAVLLTPGGPGYGVALFDGDGYSRATSRVLQNIVVTVDPQRGMIVRPVSGGWGTSSRYWVHQGAQVPNQPAWCWSTLPGEAPIDTDTIVTAPDNYRVEVGRISPTEIQVQFFVEGTNPVSPIPLTPDLEAEIEVAIRQQPGGPVQYRVLGEHDGFPAYELNLNSAPIYCYDPLVAGASPWYLGGALDQQIDTGWRPISAAASCVPPRGLRVNYGSAAPGSLLTLTGTSFLPSSTLQVAINGQAVGSAQTDPAGRFQATIDTTGANLGRYTVTVSGPATGTAQLDTTSFSLSPAAPRVEREQADGAVLAVPARSGLPLPAHLPRLER